MPKIHIAKYEPNRLGGGWSWARQFASGIGNQLSSYDEAEIYMIPSPSMVEREDVKIAKADGKYIALRLDNIVRNSRNRNTGMTRMRDIAEMADIVIYQSEFAKELLSGWVQKYSSAEFVILNACDQMIFNGDGRIETTTARYLYSRYNRDETKNYEMARAFYEKTVRSQPNSMLTIIGQFSDELREYDFDFYRNEPYRYMGVVQNPETLADIYRNNDYLIYSYFNDACSNTLIEALSCECDLVNVNYMAETGGTPEIINAWSEFGRSYFDLPRMVNEYLEALK